MESEIGRLGYSITLKSLPPHFLRDIRQELYVKPLENPNFGSSENTSYPVFRISANKIYLPRFYGISKYGNIKNELSGQPIDLSFTGTLRDEQKIVKKNLLFKYQYRPKRFKK